MRPVDVRDRGRLVAESRMGAENGSSTVTIRRATGETTWDAATRTEVPTWADVLIEVPARLATIRTNRRTVESGGVVVERATRELHIAAEHIGTPNDNDVAEVVGGEWAGRFFRLVDTTGADQTTALRMPVEEVDQPDGW